MSIKQPIYHEFDLNATSGNSRVISLTHTDDAHVDVIELCVKQQGTPVDITGATVIARMVLHGTTDVLLNDSVPCTINDAGNILIPFDNAAVQTRKGIVKIEVNITRTPDILTLQLPLWVKINGSILDSATVDPHSEGTIPELLKDAADALEEATQALEDAKDYDKLENKPQINSVTLLGNKSSDDLGLQKKLTAGQNITLESDGTISASGGVTSYNDLTDKPTVTIENQANPLSGALVFDFYEFARTLTGSNGVALSNAIFKSFFDYYYYAPYDFAQLSEHYIHTGCFYELKNRAKNIPVEFSDATSEFYIFNFGERYVPYEKLVRVVTYSTTLKIKTFIQFYSVNYNYEVLNASAWQEIGSGGSQIVSGLVNQNGTITFTDSDGQTVTTTGNSIVTSGNQQISMGYDNGGFYFLFDDGQEA